MRRLIPWLLLALIGCQTVHSKINSPESALLLPIVQAQRDLSAKNYPAVVTDLDNATLVAKQVAANDVKCQQEAQKANEFIKEHSGDIFGARTHRDTKLLLWIGLPLAAIISILCTYTGTMGIFGHTVLVALSGGLHLVTLLISWIWNKLKRLHTNSKA